MNTFILTWHPDGFEIAQDEYGVNVAATSGARTFEGSWSTGNRTSLIEPGDRFFLFRQKRDRGIIASGTFTSEAYQGDHWSGSGEIANYADVEFDEWRPLDDRLTIEELQSAVPGFKWIRLQGSGIHINDSFAAVVESLWSNGTEISDRDFEDVQITEGQSSTRTVTNYDRDPRARRACIEHWGYDCAVCGINFESMYGDRGRGFIHVHHLRDLSLSEREHVVDPVNDLRPVCANCHWMLHTERPAISIDRLQLEISMEEQRLALATE